MDDILLSWRLEDICNQDLYTNEVKEIPSEFQSVSEYLNAYTLPLIEETRAELFSALETISEAPCAKIQHVVLDNIKHGPTCKMDIPAHGFSDGTDMYEPKNGDVFVLSSLKPESIDGFFRYGVTYCLAIVKKIVELELELDEPAVKRFTMSISPTIMSEDQIQSCTYALYLTSTVTNSRIWKALQFSGADQNFALIKKALSRNQTEESTCGSTHEQNDPGMTRFLEEILSIDLNQSQLEAVKSTISAVRCNKLSYELVWGPPGTGKTKTVCSILWFLRQLKIRTLACAPTNVAVTGVAARLVHLLKKFDGRNIDSNGPPISLTDVVLFGNKGRMEVVGPLDDIFLDNRINQLKKCFLSDNNWRYCVASTIHFLEDCIRMYDMDIEKCKDGRVSLSFKDYVREQFKELKNNLLSCFRTMFVHVPRQFLSSESCTSILSVQGFLGELSEMLSGSSITDDQLKQSLGTPPASLQPVQRKIVGKREECLEQLKSLQKTLKLSSSSLTDGGSIREFCLQNATLVFCTASSSFLLHNAPKSCFNVVVIDEAAQLKECESVIPLRLNHVKHALLVGDECQLPALVQSKVSKRADFGKSLFERLVSLQHEKHLLNIQYRMHPSISLFPNNRFYGGKLLDGPNVLEDGYNNEFKHFMFGSYAVVNIADGREENHDAGKSWRNWVEVAAVVYIIKKLYGSWKKTKGKLTVGIVSPYTAQVRAIKDKVGRKYDNHVGFEVRVKSIDGFQGQEDDVVILSTVRCNTRGSVGFLDDNQRTNVAITRARHCLWVVGSATTLSRSGTVWSDIVFDAKQRGCFVDAKDDDDLSNLILNVKNDLDQLEDLMNPNSILFSSTSWKVIFSDDFLRSFARLKSKTTRMGLIQVLLRLASGWRSKRRNLNLANDSCLARVYAVADLYLVWSIDLQKDQLVYTQIIKLWNLASLVEVEGLLKRMDYIFSMYTDAYRKRCETIFIEGVTEVPMIWTDGHEIAQYKNINQNEFTGEDGDHSDTNSSLLEDSQVNESLVLMRFYALSSGAVKHLLMARDGAEIDIPFELNDEEMEIIRFPNSSFILGRSGTGKTTVLTTKLVRMEQQFFVASHGLGSSGGGPAAVVGRDHANEQMDENKVGFLKQLFLTVSPKLCSAVRGQVNRLVRFANFGELSGPLDSVTIHDHIDKLDEFADLPDNFCNLAQEHYPLIITFRKFLMMLDGTIGSSFFNKICSDWGTEMKPGGSKSRTLQALILSKEVDFDKFHGSYWPHFNEKLTKNLDAATVFTQIVSHIKGVSGSVEGAIAREQYVALSEKRFSSLGSAVRDRVYDIFLEYEKKKRAAREFDLSDFVSNLHSRLNRDGCPGCKFDFIYIDEVQDLTVSQIALLKYVCSNFKEGFVFAGDTAQTIARGIDFRFEDIRSLFYNEFISMLEGKQKASRLADMFQLCQNFRTHIGVLKLAQSVIDMLYYFFPFSVDKLKPETSLIYGGAPVLLESAGGDENAITKIFGGSKSSLGRPTEFGAEQVILVRDDSAKKEVLEIVGNRALVLTIIDCKGLEFQDVLLYNFFSLSPLENKWRVLYEYLENEDILDSSMTRSYPRFDITSHYLLCSELKQLYVAITRTRQRLWICENSTEFCKPMFDYWKRLCLVEGTLLDTDFVEGMRTASTPDDWRIRGIKLLNEKHFEMARMCFEKAGDVTNENWARAAGLVERAERHNYTNLQKAQTALQKAANIYENIRMFDKAATCYIKLGNYEKAGTIYLEKCGRSRLEEAADCFNIVKNWAQAADLYFQAHCFAKCVSSCLKGELFVTGLEYLEKWRLEEEQSKSKLKFEGVQAIRDEYLKNCANLLHHRGDSKNMMRFVKAFKSMDEIRKFLKSKSLLDELLTLELEAGNFVEAAAIAQLTEDRLLEAHVWEKACCYEKATQLVVLDVIVESLWSHGSKGWPPKSFPKREIHFKKAKDLAKKVSVCFHNSVCSELLLWDDKPKTFLKLSELLAEAEMSGNTRLTFLSLRSLLDLHLNHENSEYSFEAEPLLDSKKCYEIMAHGRMSLHMLIHIWVKWLKTALCVSSSLCEEFCHDYLGVRKYKDGTYCVLNPSAWWVGDRARAVLTKSSSGAYLMSSDVYTSSAASYWKNEVFCVGKAVVEKLDSLLRSCKQKPLSLETRGWISLAVYDIIKFLKQTASSKDYNCIQRYVSSVESWFWDAIFPWDSKNITMQGILSIIDRPSATDLISESVDQTLNLTNKKFTYGQLGKLSMILLLSGKLPDNQFKKIQQLAGSMPEWLEFFASLKDHFISGGNRITMTVNFQKALQLTYNVNWRQEHDYMSPHCYLYLLDLLTFFISSCLGSSGILITTRSVLVEIVKLKGCKIFLDSPIDQIIPETGTSSVSLGLFKFIVCSVQELLCNKREILEWIKCSHSLPGNFYNQMVLRLTIILHMAYLNMNGRDIHSAGKFLSSRYDIPRDLPRQFTSKIRQSMCSRERNTSLVAFVEAFASVGDPLVVVSKKKDNYVFPPSNFFFFRCDEMRDRDHVMSILFPGSVGPDVAPFMVSCTDLSSSTAASDLTSGTKDSQGKMEDKLVKMLEAFQQCEKNDYRVTIDILGTLQSWLHQSKPPKRFYDLLVEEIRGVYDHFVKTTFLSEGKYTYPSLESLFSYWKDGEAKLNLIIDTLISNKMSKEASDSNTEDAATPEKSEIIAPAVAVAEKKEVEAREGQEDTLKEPFWGVLETFQLKSYPKEDVKAIANLLLAAHSLLEENKSLISFDEQLVEEMKSVYNSILDLVARGGRPTLEDVYSQWPHGETKLKLVVDTLLLAYHERRSPDGKEVSKNRPDKETLAEDKAVVKMDAGPSNPQKLNNQKTNKKTKKKGKKSRR